MNLIGKITGRQRIKASCWTPFKPCVMIADSKEQFPQQGTDGYLYVDRSSNTIYRWDTTTNSYVPVGEKYQLPVATKTILGGVKIGDNITSNDDGTVSLTDQNIISALGYKPVENAKEYEIGNPTNAGITKLYEGVGEAVDGTINQRGLSILLNSKATKEEVNLKADKTELDSKADKSQLTGFATKKELESKADASALTNYALKNDVDQSLATKADKSELGNLATKTELSKKADKSQLINLATKQDLANKADTSDLNSYALKIDVNNSLLAKADKSELANLATKTELSKKADKSQLINLATKQDLANKADTSDLNSYALKIDVNNSLLAKADKSELANLATKTELTDKADKTELEPYATKNELSAGLNSKLGKTDTAVSATTADKCSKDIRNQAIDSTYIKGVLVRGTQLIVTKGNGVSNTIDLPAGGGGGAGTPGPYFTPSVDELGNLSWTNNGGLDNPSTVNIKGPRGLSGEPGINGTDGRNGQDGESAYQVAVNNGYIGSEQQWLASLKGKDGKDGERGPRGLKGHDGNTGPKGDDGAAGPPGPAGKDGADGAIGPQGEPGRDGLPGAKGEDGLPGPAGKDGADGFSPTITVASNTESEFKLYITDKSGTSITPNLKGPKGDKGDDGTGGGGELPANHKKEFTTSQWSGNSLTLTNVTAIYAVYKQIGSAFEDALVKISITSNQATITAPAPFNGYAIVGVSAEVAIPIADKAVGDGEGNNIVSTYATKVELSNKADKSQLSNLATKQDLNSKANTSDLNSKADKSELKDTVKFTADGGILFPNGIKMVVRA